MMTGHAIDCYCGKHPCIWPACYANAAIDFQREVDRIVEPVLARLRAHRQAAIELDEAARRQTAALGVPALEPREGLGL